MGSQIQTAHLNIFIFITMNFKYLFVIATLVLDSEALFFKKRQRNNQNRRRSGGNRQRSSRNECYSDNQCWTRKCVKYDDALCGAGNFIRGIFGGRRNQKNCSYWKCASCTSNSHCSSGQYCSGYTCVNTYNPSTDYNSYTTEDPFKSFYDVDRKYGNENYKNPWEQDYKSYVPSYATEDPFKYANNFEQKYNNFDDFKPAPAPSYNFDF